MNIGGQARSASVSNAQIVCNLHNSFGLYMCSEDTLGNSAVARWDEAAWRRGDQRASLQQA